MYWFHVFVTCISMHCIFFYFDLCLHLDNGKHGPSKGQFFFSFPQALCCWIKSNVDIPSGRPFVAVFKPMVGRIHVPNIALGRFGWLGHAEFGFFGGLVVFLASRRLGRGSFRHEWWYFVGTRRHLDFVEDVSHRVEKSPPWCHAMLRSLADMIAFASHKFVVACRVMKFVRMVAVMKVRPCRGSLLQVANGLFGRRRRWNQNLDHGLLCLYLIWMLDMTKQYWCNSSAICENVRGDKCKLSSHEVGGMLSMVGNKTPPSIYAFPKETTYCI
mgnify:CR=1 FL=1